MARKQRRLALVKPTPPRSNTPPPAFSRPYGWRPERALDQIPNFPHENWLRYQASSILGRPATVEEAEELFRRIDINTRRPIEPAAPPRWWQRLLPWIG